MARAVFTNNARTTLSGSLTNVATSASVVDGSVFPAPTGGDYAYLTIEEGVLVEIVKLTARSTNTLTITRAQDDTTAQAFTTAATVSLRLPRIVLGEIFEEIDTGPLALSRVTGLGTGVATALAVNTGSAGAFAVLDGALGTPSSGTLTNATGLPVAGLVSSTSTALGVGTLELGHASDTTLARASAGVVTVEGKRVYTVAGLVDLAETQAADSIGTRGVPQNSQSGAYTLVIEDAGKHILHPSADTTARTFTIPANGSVAFPIGTVVTFVNQNSAGVITIAITTDTMRLAGAGTTGSRTLAANGIATAIKLTSTEWIISGSGLT